MPVTSVKRSQPSSLSANHVRIDVFFCALSLAVAVGCNPLRVLKQIWAHIVVMGLFAVFVFWNGSVVLGTSPPRPKSFSSSPVPPVPSAHIRK